MRQSSYEPSRKRNPISEQQHRGHSVQMVANEGESKSTSDSQTDGAYYTDTDENVVYEEVHDSNLYVDEVDQADRGQSPRGRTNSKNQSLAKPHTKRRNASRNARDKIPVYEDDASTNTRHMRPEEGQIIRKRRHKKDQQESYRQQNQSHVRQNTRQDDEQITPETTTTKENSRGGRRYIEPIAAPKDRHTQRQRNVSKKADHEHNMQPFTGNDSLTESIQREGDARFLHPHRYPRARANDSEYAAILDDYAELYKIRITIPEEQVAMLSRELKTIKGQVVDIQGRLDDTFASVLSYMEEGKQDVRQLVSSIQGISSNMSTFYKDVDMRLRDANEQMPANRLSLKAAPEKQFNDNDFLELLDVHLKTSLASYLPIYLQSCQNYPPLDGKVNPNNAGSNCEMVDPMTVSVRQLRAPLPLTDTSSVEEKYKILEQKYNRALVTIKAMRLTAGLDCVPVNTEADYLEFLRELENRTGPTNREFSKGRYMLKIRGINDGTDAYVGILDVTSDDNILLRHRQLPDTLSTDTREQLKKDMVMRINDMSYVVHEIYESLLPPPSADNE